jgi:hypothetical protein
LNITEFVDETAAPTGLENFCNAGFYKDFASDEAGERRRFQLQRSCIIQPSVGRRGRATLGGGGKIKTTLKELWRH